MGLLSETGVTPRKPALFDSRGLKSFCNSEVNGYDFGFDVFSAVFYFISRYEEWQPFKPDANGRFEARESLLVKNDMQLVPWVDRWIALLREKLMQKFPELKLARPKLRDLATIDVDNLYAYRRKGLLRTVGGAIKDLFRSDFSGFSERMKVLSGRSHDPFDVYEKVSAWCAKRDIPLIYFFLYGGDTKYDRGIVPSEAVFGEVFNLLKEHGATLGLHPSYNSFRDRSLLKTQKQLLEEHSVSTITFSRQHYLRFDIRKTPQLLIEAGITTDFTMGFATQPGFRAGTAYPFYYYDFDNEEQGNLLFVPFCAMDGAYTTYSNTTPQETIDQLRSLRAEVAKTGGWYVTVFHERTFSERLYPEYSQVFFDQFR